MEAGVDRVDRVDMTDLKTRGANFSHLFTSFHRHLVGETGYLRHWRGREWYVVYGYVDLCRSMSHFLYVGLHKITAISTTSDSAILSPLL